MDFNYFFYALIPPVATYALAAVLGALVLPLFLAPERILGFVSGMTAHELNRRDKILYPLSRIFIRMRIHPNVITVAGVVLVAWLLAAFLREAGPAVIFTLTVAAGFTDMIDGPVARAAGQVSVTGGILDMLRDMMLIVVISVGAVIYGLIDLRLLIWFFGGEAVIFILKVMGSRNSDATASPMHEFLWRFAGEGKPIFDRVKFFFFVAAIAASVFDTTFQSNFGILTTLLFFCSIFTVVSSILIHSSLLSISRYLTAGH